MPTAKKFPKKSVQTAADDVRKIGAAKPSAVLFIAEDEVRRMRAQQVCAQAAGLFDKQTDSWLIAPKRLNILTLSEPDLKNLIGEINSISLFQAQNFYIISGLEKISAAKTDLLLKLLAANREGVIYLHATKLPASSRVYKELKKRDALITLRAFIKSELRNWILREFKNRAISADQASVELILEAACGEEQQQTDFAAKMIEQLDLYSNNQQITAEDTNNLFPYTKSYSEYELVDYLKEENYPKAVKSLNSVYQDNFVGMQFLGLINHNYLTQLLVSRLSELGSSKQKICQVTKISPYFYDSYSKFSRNKSWQHFAAGLKDILLTEWQLKSKSLNEKLIFWHLIYRLSTNEKN